MVRSLDSMGEEEEEDGWVLRASEAEWRVRRRRMEEERDLRAAEERSDLMRPPPIIFTGRVLFLSFLIILIAFSFSHCLVIYFQYSFISFFFFFELILFYILLYI